jgi:polar amino acid transport system substrate-binding protein
VHSVDEHLRLWSRRRVLEVAALVGGLTAAGGCAAIGLGDTLGRIRDAGVIRVGIAGERPYAYLEGDELTGGIAAVHREVFRRIGDVDVEGVVVPFGELIEGLNGGSYDAVAAGMFVTASRCELVAFSDPVYCALISLLVPAGNPNRLTDFVTVAAGQARLAVLGGAVEAEYARGAGVPDDLIVQVGTPEDGLDAVTSGDAEAFALTSVSLRSLVAQAGPGAQVELTAPFTPVVEGRPVLGCGAAAFRAPDDELRIAFNRELSALRADGALLQLMAPFGFTEAEMASPDVTTEQLCATGGAPGGELDPLPR